MRIVIPEEGNGQVGRVLPRGTSTPPVKEVV
jgi:hypothetical protein